MNHDSVEVKPRTVDWSEGYSEKWDYWGAADCPHCRQEIVNRGDECKACGKTNDEGCDGPMMNYFYPLPVPDYSAENWDAMEAARKIAHLPLCIVQMDKEWGLALTGGGMDLSWEICAAYVALDFLPPAHFCRDLPRYAGMKLTAEKRRVIAACRESLRCQRDWNARALSRLRDTTKSMRTNALLPFTLQLDNDNFWTIRKDGKLLRRVPADKENGGMNFYRHRKDALAAVKTLKKKAGAR